MLDRLRPKTMLALALMSLASLAALGCESKSHLTAPLAESDGPAPISAVRTLDGPAGLAGLIASEEDALLADSPDGATPITGPTVITKAGHYRLTRDFAVNDAGGDGIVVRSDGVLLWLGDHEIRGPGNKSGRGIVLEGASEVLVHGGQLRRFGVGVALVDANRCAVRGVSIEGGDEVANPPAGVPPQIGLLLVNSAMNRVARNELEGVNLGIFVRGPGSYENRIRRNEVRAGIHGLLGICYNPAPGAGPAGPTRDRVTHNTLSRFGTGIQTSAGSAMNYFTANTIEYFSQAYQDFNGTNVFERNRTRQVSP
jgi:hypothetical protein